MASRRVRFLLLQARDAGDPMREHEQRCFAETMAVSLEAIVPWDLLGGVPTAADLEAVDAVLVGGSGSYSVLGKHAFVRPFLDFIADQVVARAFPTFASCFGFQALVVAGGGKVVTDAARSEVGTFTLEVTEAGRRDPLIGPLAPTFKAQLGHKDHAERLPAGFIHLARSERSPFQALRVEGAPIFATQFHPELTRETNTERYLRYWDSYGSGDVEDDPVLASMAATPGASALLSRWVVEELLPLRGFPGPRVAPRRTGSR